MLHWNSLWAPTQPDGKTELETAPVWKEPWPAEQMMAWQTLAWEQMLNASHAVLSVWTAWWSMPAWMMQGMGDTLPRAANDDVAHPDAVPAERPASKRGGRGHSR
jgi:hypothetical protein